MDITEEEKEAVKAAEEKYKFNHVGWKIAEAALIPATMSGNNETNKLKIIKYIHEKGYKVDSVKIRGFGRVELNFNDYRDANKCLSDRQTGGHEKIIEFFILKGAKTCKRVVSGWDLNATLDELVESMDCPNNVIELERMKKRHYKRK